MQFAALHHALSHIDPGAGAPAGHHLPPCPECAGSMPLLAGLSGVASIAVVLEATVEAGPRIAGAVQFATRTRRSYLSRAPPR
jgi:hypothetical protein